MADRRRFKYTKCSLHTLRRDLANCNRKREALFFEFLRARLAIGVIMRLAFPAKEEQAWSECPMPAQKVILWIEVEGFHILWNNSIEKMPPASLVIIP